MGSKWGLNFSVIKITLSLLGILLVLFESIQLSLENTLQLLNIPLDHLAVVNFVTLLVIPNELTLVFFQAS